MVQRSSCNILPSPAQAWLQSCDHLFDRGRKTPPQPAWLKTSKMVTTVWVNVSTFMSVKHQDMFGTVSFSICKPGTTLYFYRDLRTITSLVYGNKQQIFWSKSWRFTHRNQVVFCFKQTRAPPPTDRRLLSRAWRSEAGNGNCHCLVWLGVARSASGKTQRHGLQNANGGSSRWCKITCTFTFTWNELIAF